MTLRPPRARTAVAGLALLAVAATTVSAQLPASAEDQPAPGASGLLDPDAVVTLGDSVAGLADLTSPLAADGTLQRVAPTTVQRDAARALGPAVRVQWNDSGTPASIFPTGGVLARPAGATPQARARAWVTDNLALLGISAEQARRLELVGDQPLAGGGGHAVLLRQRFGDLVPATRGMVTVGVAPDGAVTYVSSSLSKVTSAPAPARLTALQGWLRAATDVGRGVQASAVTVLDGATGAADQALAAAGWTQLRVPGFDQAQLARVRAFARPDGTVVPVVEANVVDTTGGTALAYRVLVDAVSGDVVFRQDAVENSSDAFAFQGAYPAGGCGPKHPFTLTDDATTTIAVLAAAVLPTEDITIRLYDAGGAQLQEADLLTSPELASFTAPGGTFAEATYSVAVCAFDDAQLGSPYTANVLTSDVALGGGGAGSLLPNPTWRAFPANPALATLGTTTGASPDTSVVECWIATVGCSSGEAHENLFSFGAWDTLNGVPTFTTLGNNASTREAWGSPLTPGGLAQAPTSLTREYTTAFTDAWNNSGCNPANLVPGGNDIDAVTGNLFVGHNRIHDFAYALGFTERNYNLQALNGDRGGLGGDPEIGNVQAGAITGGAAGMNLGRDNANQIALQDGVPGITNQYLFQPIAAAFYSPCADGSLDTGIYGHEYTHAISNRMVGGPDDGLTSEQGGAMGESWSDLVAAEYQFENDYLSDPAVAKNPWALGAYATGNDAKGIRDYAINDNPLNFSDYGFDTTGAEVHSDGEIWNGTLWEVRQALVDAWDAEFPYADKDLQERCEQPTADPTRGQLPADACPGNRRWLQLVFDSFLLQQGATDMLQARDAMLAADRMRFDGENQAVIASAFARRGMGADASTTTPDDGGEDATVPSFRSSYGANSAVTFSSTRPGKVYVGDYEARATPVAETGTDGASPTATFTPGIYRILFVSPTSGFRRLLLTVPASGAAITQVIDDSAPNLASAQDGASVIATTGTPLNADALIDGTEATNWSGSTGDANVDDAAADGAPTSVAVDLAGGAATLTSAKVSALLRPAPAEAGLPVVGAGGEALEEDPLSGSRFTALRQFALEACTADCGSADATWDRFFTSAADAFPGDVPRPVAPDQTMRSFTFPPVQASAVRLVALENQCTGQERYADSSGAYTDPLTGEPSLDADPAAGTDCKTATEAMGRGTVVHAAELQVFGAPVPSDPAPGTPGDGTPGSGTPGQGTGALPAPGQPAAAQPSAAPGAGQARTKVRIRLPRVQQVRGAESTPLKFAVVSTRPSVGRAGTAVVRLDGRKVLKVAMAVGPRQGRKVVGPTYRVPRTLPFGVHKLRVRFKSADPAAYRGAQSRRITLTVVRSRPNAG